MPEETPFSGPAPDALFREMRERVRDMFEHALAECEIARAFSRSLQCQGRYLELQDTVYDLGAFQRAVVISIGKAGHTMAEAFANLVGSGTTGIVATPVAPPAQLFGFRYFIGGHPLPNEDSLRAAHAILRLVQAPTPETLAVFLISGGASAIAEKPISTAMSLDDVVQTYKALVHSGATIAEINAIRKHLSALKGGRLARAAAPAHQLSILVSDVPENALDALASGPTMPDSTTVADCYTLAQHYKLLEQFPPQVRSLFDGRQLPETPKAGDFAFARSRYVTVLSNASAVNAAVESAAMAGFAVEVDNSCDDWDYQRAADHLLRRLQELRRGVSRACLISGGEVTVKVQGQSGVGGRNQQFALYCAQKIAGLRITVLSAGTDGIDGNSTAAGAVVDGSTVERARQAGLSPEKSLATFDAFTFFEALGDTLITGPTGNNLRDLRIMLAY